MLKIFQGFKAISDVIGFNNLPRAERRITFYSEGKNYWPHLEGLLRAVLEKENYAVCYISSSLDDPGLQLDHPLLKKFFVGHGFIRDYLFQTLDTDIMVMTMPDLHQYQVKRSRHKVHYIYVQHSLVSLHMIYRHGAFDHYDTICCAGPHHVQEVRAIESAYSLPKKNIIELGYSRLDQLKRFAEKHNKAKADKNKSTQCKRILIAPSWCEDGLIESGLGLTLVNQLIELGHEVILRPHPQTIKFANAKVKEIVSRHGQNPLFLFEDNVAGQDSLHSSDLMISDWSGAALEYAFALKKPIIFCDVPRKINNSNYKDIDLAPIEVHIRDKLGVVWDKKKPIKEALQKCMNIKQENIDALIKQYVFNSGCSDQKFTKEIYRILK